MLFATCASVFASEDLESAYTAFQLAANDWKFVSYSSHHCACAHTHSTVLQPSGFFMGQPGWAGTRRNIHPLTPTVVISHPLSASSIYCNPWHPASSIYMPGSLFPQSFSKYSLIYLLSWHPQLSTAYISSPNHCLLSVCKLVIPHLTSSSLGCNLSQYHCINPIFTEFQYPLACIISAASPDKPGALCLFIFFNAAATLSILIQSAGPSLTPAVMTLGNWCDWRDLSYFRSQWIMRCNEWMILLASIGKGHPAWKI